MLLAQNGMKLEEWTISSEADLDGEKLIPSEISFLSYVYALGRCQRVQEHHCMHLTLSSDFSKL